MKSQAQLGAIAMNLETLPATLLLLLRSIFDICTARPNPAAA
jgi:hypothetical protein